jgi:hypothetical protein
VPCGTRHESVNSISDVHSVPFKTVTTQLCISPHNAGYKKLLASPTDELNPEGGWQQHGVLPSAFCTQSRATDSILSELAADAYSN